MQTMLQVSKFTVMRRRTVKSIVPFSQVHDIHPGHTFLLGNGNVPDESAQSMGQLDESEVELIHPGLKCAQ